MNEKYSALFTPWKIGNVEIKNRIVQPSMGGTSLFGWLEPCHFDKEAAYHILNRAQNNVGLVLPGMQCVRDTMGGRWLYQNKKMFKDLAEWLPEFHKTGSKLFVQLSAGMGRSMAINEIMVKMLQNKAFGAVGKPFLNVDYITASASATPNRWYPECKSRPLTVEEIQEVVAAFAAAAKRAVACGYDFIEIHAAHGYLLHEFLSPLSNHRTDSYGGSFENRIRLVKEVACAVRKAIPEGMPLFVRISASDLVEGNSWDVPEAAKLCTELVQNCGVDMMDISSAGLSDQQVIPSNWDFQEQMSHTIKKETGVVCSAVGGICDAASASYVVDELGIDIVEIGKAALFHFFKNLDLGSNRFINGLAGTTLGVYILHQVPVLRDFLWNGIFHAQAHHGSAAYTLLVIVLTFAGCAAIDTLRTRFIMQPLQRCRAFTAFCVKGDALAAEIEKQSD